MLGAVVKENYFPVLPNTYSEARKKIQLDIKDWKYVHGRRECGKDLQVMGVNLMKMSC